MPAELDGCCGLARVKCAEHKSIENFAVRPCGVVAGVIRKLAVFEEFVRQEVIRRGVVHF
ncbi:hypothetical protein D3C87_2053560 [compost metagenome]